jgi:type II secretory pathway component PulM
MVAIVVITVCTLAIIWFVFLEPYLLRRHRERQLAEAKQFNRDLDAYLADERNRMAVAMRAWQTGKICVGDVDEEGNLTISEIDEAPASTEAVK